MAWHVHKPDLPRFQCQICAQSWSFSYLDPRSRARGTRLVFLILCLILCSVSQHTHSRSGPGLFPSNSVSCCVGGKECLSTAKLTVSTIIALLCLPRFRFLPGSRTLQAGVERYLHASCTIYISPPHLLN